ncbi:MAG: MFS transporter [Prevotella sp.]|nr:MFS transporter [Prevotella sp.]
MERLWNSNYIKVMIANFSLFTAFYLLTPLLPLYLHETFGATKDVIGLVLSGYTITALLFRPFSGFFVDSFPRKTVLMVCFTAFAIFFAGYLAASTLLLFTIVRTLHGGPFGALTVANSTVAIDVLPSSRRNEGIGYYGLSNNLAMAIAPSFAVFIYAETHNFQLLFWLALIVATFGLIIDATVKLPQKAPVQAKRALSLDRFFLQRGWLLGINMVFFGFCFGVLSNYLAIYGKQVMGITGGTGTWFMLCSVGLILSRLQGGRALRKGLLTHNAAEGMVISLVGYTLFILMPTLYQLSIVNYQLSIAFGYYGSALLIGLGNGHMWPAFQNMMISMAHHNERGTANSTILISWDVGMGLGILLGGILAELYGYATAFWTVAIVNLTGVLLFFLRCRHFFLVRRLSTDTR